ncbi:UNKNOWN [Stylonychia lemnae]|uniref:RCC1-like domain-containing protein n=1 Tax=Stylonychia lemnae TaxID=5949 RepID=A0A078A8D6_STYLE|nr:UNKNOWN [Stylonychia lemnae]|eukprot:CDW78489.1 UNKNOWN [Stylonychia lemnae]
MIKIHCVSDKDPARVIFEKQDLRKELQISLAQIESGKHHSMALTQDGLLYVWGLGLNGQLGLSIDQHLTYQNKVNGQFLDVLLKFLVNLINIDQERFQQNTTMTIGSYHSFVINQAGQLFGCGQSLNGKLGIEADNKAVTQFIHIRVVENGQEIKFKQIACGNEFTLALSNEGDIYSTGSGEFNIHGIAQTSSIVLINSSERNCAAIDNDGRAYVWGDNSHFQCGNPNDIKPTGDDLISAFQPFQRLYDQFRVNAVACGGYHTLFLTSDKSVYSLGSNQYGQLGLCLSDDNQSYRDPMKIKFFQDKIITAISCGSFHSIAVTIEGYAYSWGRNDQGQLGQGDHVSTKSESKQGLPKLIESILGRGIIGVNAKYNQSFFYSTDTNSAKGNDDLFQIWKQKFIKHEEAHAVMINYEYRNEKRLMKLQEHKINFQGQSSNKVGVQSQHNQSKMVNDSIMKKLQDERSNSDQIQNQQQLEQFKQQKKLLKYEYIAFENDNCEIIGFKRQNPQTKKTYVNYASQFPFQGLSDKMTINSKPQNQEEFLRMLLSSQSTITQLNQSSVDQNTKQNQQLPQQTLTDKLIQDNPFVFLMNKMKVEQMMISTENEIDEVGNETGRKVEILKVEKDFSLFQRRNQYPYDIISNPFKISPN